VREKSLARGYEQTAILLTTAEKIFNDYWISIWRTRTRILAISANPLRDWKAKELAAIGKVSYSGFRALFQKSGQGTIREQIQRARLDQARLLLADARLSVKDVAAQLSFSSEFYFSHFFRHHTGMSPSRFRRHLKS
jgi:AraC-like DNA-binding protein